MYLGKKNSMTSLLQFPNMEIWFKMDLTQSLFSDFFYRLSFSFNRAETSSFAHSVQRVNEVSGTRGSRGADWLERKVLKLVLLPFFVMSLISHICYQLFTFTSVDITFLFLSYVLFSVFPTHTS
jgi:hypothetical protein